MSQILKIGQVLGIGSTKIYGVLLITLLTVLIITSNFFRLPYYTNFVQIKLINNILLEITMYICTILIIFNGTFYKKNYWLILIEILRNQGAKYYRYFIIAQIVFAILDWCSILAWMDVEGANFFTQYTIDVIMLYYQFFISCVMITLTKIIGNEYQKLRHEIKFCNFGILRKKIVFLGECVNIFNQIFGFCFVCFTVTSGLTVVEYLDDIFKNSYGYSKQQYFFIVGANLITILQTLVSHNFLFFGKNV